MPSLLQTSLAIICLLGAGISAAQESSRAVASVEVPQTASAPEASPPPKQPDRRITIGRSTQDLLAMQRASQGARPRPIDGEQAGRSYQRYLRSFETEIPEHFDTGLGVKKR